MKRTKRFLAFVLAACMIFGMLPALSASAEEGEAASSNYMEVVGSGTNSYLSTVGSNAFNVLMYNNTFSGVFGDQHMGGIELSLNGMRIATNGDLHMLPTPEQWDATPAPSRGTPVLDQENATITIPMTFSGSPDGVLKYDLVAKSIDGGVCMEMILRSEMPADLIGKARFNLEFRPASYRNKSYQADLNADGTYDSFGVFPLHPQDEMVETERPNLPSQTWYVKEWNVDRGDDQPVPFATAYGFAFSPEDEETAIDIEAANGDLLELYDGRNRAQNGWYVLSTLIAATKPGDVAIAWNIRPHVKEGWVRDPNVGFSQVGYSPYQEKFAVVELDKWDENYPKTMALYRVNADGSEEKVCEKELGDTTAWMRFKYARFDFTEVTEVGLYRIHYGDYVGEVFPISKEVYDNIWQTCLSGFMAVQMDHISVREGYKIWHGASHMDDLSFGPAGTSYFDGQSTPAQLPASVRAKGHTELEHIEGMNKGGWFDAGDFDIQTARNTQVLGYFIDAAESWDNMNGYDDLTVIWDDATGGTVEMHRPDGVPDVVQQVVHGAKQIIAQYDILGVIGGTVEVRTLRQYTHLGDPSSDTDGWIYDPELGPGDVVEKDGKVYSGVPDDRYMMLGGGGGGGSFFGNATSFAATAYIAAPYYPEFAQYAMKAANDVWYNEHMSAAPTVSGEWNQLVQFTLATKRLEELGISYAHEDELNYAYYKARLDQLADEAVSGGISNRVNCLYIMDIMDDDYRAKCAEAAEKVADSLTLNTQPYGVNFTSGSGWGASPNTYSGVRNISMIYHFFPNEKFKTNILRSVDYLLGRHPATNSSWISGIGTKSMLHPYNSNRAEESYIPGSILPGHITFGDYVESMDDFNFLWFENESIINYQSSWLPVGIAAGQIAHDEEEAPIAETKDFTSSFDAELVTKTTSSWGGTTSNYYFSDDGFNMIMYATTFDRTFGDQHCAGIELIQDGRRIATNGDIHLLPTPEQWDATPPPTKGTVTAEGNTVTVPMTIPAETFSDGTPENPAVPYKLIAEPEEGGIKLTVKLDAPLPADLVGKAGFNMEFLPAVFMEKSFMCDTDGDGVYDDFGIFQRDPRDQMVEMERARTNNQAWYVQEWNDDRGDYQPMPFAEGKKMTFAAESDEYRIRIASDDGLALYDGRNRAQNGWYVLRTLIPEGATEIVWHISPDTNEGWTREPNISHSQVGYEPKLSKVAVIELDPNYSGSDSATLKRVNADGTYTDVVTKPLGEAKSWQRYVYRNFDFSEVEERGTYVIDYDGFVSDPFAIEPGVYSDIWTESVGNYMAVQMDHMRIREGYKIWRNAAHMDDALQAPAGVSYFDGQRMGSTVNSGYEAYERIPGLDVGGFSDAGDFDIQVAQNLAVINSLAMAYQVYGNDYDTLDVDWDTHNVELHRSDGTADIVELAKHGALNIAAQIDATTKEDGTLGFLASVIEVPTLRQYTHLGDGSKDTDNLYYDASLAEDEVDGRRSGKRDDRLAFFTTKSSSRQLSAAQALAATASVLDDSDPDKAHFIELAEKIWVEEEASHAETSTSDWNAAIELFAATGKDVYKDRILALLDNRLTTSGSRPAFSSAGWRVVKVLDKLGDEAKEKFEAALDAYAPNIGIPTANNPYGVANTTGMWGGSGSVVSGAIMASVLHKYYPDKVSTDSVYRAINYILGTHPYNSTSWISGVGTNSLRKGYGSNRADFFYIAGGLAPGYVPIAPDFPEALDDFNFLWFENEYTVEVTANWILLTLGADEFARELDEPCEHDYQPKVKAPTCESQGYTTWICTKCFDSYDADYTDALGHDYDDGVITKEPLIGFEGEKTYTCSRCGLKYTEPVPPLEGKIDMSNIDFTTAEADGRYVLDFPGTAERRDETGMYVPSTTASFETVGEDFKPSDVIKIPVTGDEWTATMKFNASVVTSAWGGNTDFLGFYVMDNFNNGVGMRGNNGNLQNWSRKNGSVTVNNPDNGAAAAANGLNTNDKVHWYRIAKSGDDYVCSYSADGEEFTELFTFTDSGIEGKMLVIDAYKTGWSFGGNNSYNIEYVNFDVPAAPEYVKADAIEAGKQYVIVADAAYAMTNAEVPGKASYSGASTTRGAVAVEIADGKIVSEVTDDMLWTFEEATSAAAYDGMAQYWLVDADGKYLRRGSMSRSNAALILDDALTATARYYTWSFKPYEDGSGYAMYVNSERAYGSDYPGRVGGDAAGFDIPGGLSQRSPDDPFAFMNDASISHITLYTLSEGGSEPEEPEEPEIPIEHPEIPIWENTEYSFAERAADLVGRMTVEQKASQIVNNTAAIPAAKLGNGALNVPSTKDLGRYTWWSETLHGCGGGVNYPQNTTVASTWNPDLYYQESTNIGQEIRERGVTNLNYYSPTINMHRDPRWGRNEESYSEDVLLTAAMGTAWAQGLEGKDREGKPLDPDGYYMAHSTIKHYVANNNEGKNANDTTGRLRAGAISSLRMLREYYALPYGEIIRGANISSVMTAYNYFGVEEGKFDPSSYSSYLMDTLLRQVYGLQGHVTSDCDSVASMQNLHYINRHTGEEITVIEALSGALAHGEDLECNGGHSSSGSGTSGFHTDYKAQINEMIDQAVETDKGIFTENTVDISVHRLMTARIQTGEFDGDTKIKQDAAERQANADALRAQRRELVEKINGEGVVMLQNNGALPLDLSENGVKSVVIVGSHQTSTYTGLYSQASANQLNIQRGITEAVTAKKADVEFTLITSNTLTDENKAAIEAADAVIVVVGTGNGDSAEDRDRASIILPNNLEDLLSTVGKLNANTIVCMETCGPMRVRTWKDDVNAILWSSFGGQWKTGFGQIISGAVNPSGKTTDTWYQDVADEGESDVPAVTDYDLLPSEGKNGRTYMYYDGYKGTRAAKAPSYPFGYGLSYTTFEYSNLKIDKTSYDANDTVKVSFDVKNTGSVAGKEVTQLYVAQPEAPAELKRPIRRLEGFQKIELQPGETKTVSMEVKIEDLAFFDEAKDCFDVDLGAYQVQVGTNSMAAADLTADFTVTGKLEEYPVLLTVKANAAGDSEHGIEQRLIYNRGNMINPQLTVCMNNEKLYGYIIANSKSNIKQLSSTPLPEGMTFKYRSNRSSVVKVDGDQIQAVGPGVATVTVTGKLDDYEVKADFVVYVKVATDVDDITANGETLEKFSPTKYNYSIRLEEGEPIPEIAAVSSNPDLDVVVTQATELPGVATVVATDRESGLSQTYTINIKVRPSASFLPGIDFTNPADAEKYEIVAKDTAEVQKYIGIETSPTLDAFEPVSTSFWGGETLASEPKDLIKIPVSKDWTATLCLDYDPNNVSFAWSTYFAFLAMQGDDYKNMVGIRATNSTFQDYLRKNGSVEDATASPADSGFRRKGYYWLRLQKDDTTYTAYWSTDGENFTKAFTLEDTGIDADYILIDAYKTMNFSWGGSTGSWLFTLKNLEYENEGIDLSAYEPEVASIGVNGEAIAFNPDTYTYNVAVDRNGAAPVIGAWKGNDATKITVIPVAGSAGTGKVIASVGDKVKTYTLSFNYKPESDYFADGDFNASYWTVVNEDAEAYSVEKGKGIVMPTQRNDIYQNGSEWSNAFLMPAMSNWEVVAKVVYPTPPAANYQQGMFLYWQDENNYIRMNTQYSSWNNARVIVEPGRETNGSFSGASGVGVTYEAGQPLTVYYKIKKDGSNITGSFSQDGQTFTDVYSAENVEYSDPQLALFATMNNSGDPIDVQFEYVYVAARDGLQPDFVEMLNWAAQNVADYIAADLPAEASEDLVLSPAPNGYTVTLTSSDPAVIAADGKVTPDAEDKDVTVTVTAEADGFSGISAPVTIHVPGDGGPEIEVPIEHPELPIWENQYDYTFAERAADLIARMSVAQKGAQSVSTASAISASALGGGALNVPATKGIANYEWWSEALHGYSRGQTSGAVIYPQNLTIASTWNPELYYRQAVEIGDEIREKTQKNSETGNSKNLNFYSPTVNMHRDPRWGRNEESFSEDVYLTGTMASEFVKGMEGKDRDGNLLDPDGYLKTMCTTKHYVANNSERNRLNGGATSDLRALREYYAAPYAMVIRNADVRSVMTAYSTFNGEPSSYSSYLMDTLLRQTYGFTGHITSDCDSVATQNRLAYVNPYTGETMTDLEALAGALAHGEDLECNGGYSGFGTYSSKMSRMLDAAPMTDKGVFTENAVDISLLHMFTDRIATGEFDENLAYTAAAQARVDAGEGGQSAKRLAIIDEVNREGVVMLQNNGLLPLQIPAEGDFNVVVVGSWQTNTYTGLYSAGVSGNSNVNIQKGITDAIKAKNADATFTYITSNSLTEENEAAIKAADVVVVVTGTGSSYSKEDGDRTTIALPDNQAALISNVGKMNPKTIAIMETCGAMQVKTFQNDVAAILWSSYGGLRKGVGFGEIITGATNPSGKLTDTWYQDVNDATGAESDIPSIYDYNLYATDGSNGRTYMYYKGEKAPSYPFGYGLSFTTFEYSDLTIDKTAYDANDTVKVSFKVKNTGAVAGKEVTQLYVAQPDAPAELNRPIRRLEGFEKIELQPGETKTVEMEVKIPDLAFFDETDKRFEVDTGAYQIQVGTDSAHADLRKDFTVSGEMDVYPVLLTVKANAVGDTEQGIEQRLIYDKGAIVNPQLTVAMNDESLCGYVIAHQSSPIDQVASSPLPEGMKFTYKSNRPSVVSCKGGVIKAVNAGVATITVTGKLDDHVVTADFVVYVEASSKIDGITLDGEPMAGFNREKYGYELNAADFSKAPVVGFISNTEGLNITVEQFDGIPGVAVITSVDEASGTTSVYRIGIGNPPVSTDFSEGWAAAEAKGWKVEGGNMNATFGENGLTIVSQTEAGTNVYSEPAYGEWAAQTKVTLAEGYGANGQQAGLIVKDTDNTYVKLVYERTTSSSGWGGSRTYYYVTAYAVNNGEQTQVARTGNLGSLTEMNLRVIKSGNAYTFSYSADGANWTDMSGNAKVNMADPKIGPFVSNVEGVTATFDGINVCKVSELYPRLASVKLNGAVLTEFDPETFIYNFPVEADAAAPVLEATGADESIKVEITQLDTATGEATIRAYNDVTEAVYRFYFDLAPVSDYLADGAISERWSIEREDPEVYSIEKGKGLVMPTQAGDIHGTGGAWKNAFVMPAQGNWQAVAKVVYPHVPTANYQQAMFLVWQDENNYLRMNCQTSNLNMEPGVETAGSFNGNLGNGVALPAEDGTVTLYFMIDKAGNDYTVGYSQDGVNFTKLRTATANFANPKIGLFATQNSSSAQMDMYFEYVAVTWLNGVEQMTYPDMQTWAAQNVADYVAADLPAETSENIELSPVPHGYTVTLNSSDPAVIAADGTVTPAAEDKDVTVTVTATNGYDATSAAKTIKVKAGGAPVLDKAALEAAIAAAEAIDKSLYTDETVAAMEAKLAAAKAALASEDQAAVDAAASALNDAVAALELKPVIPPVDYTALNAAIAAAEAVDKSLYTDETVAAMEAKLAAAKAALASEDQAAVDAAASALNDAVAALELKPVIPPVDYTALNAAIAAAEAVDKSLYTDETVAAMEAKLAAAKAALAAEDQAAVDAAAAALNAAVAALEVKPEPGPDLSELYRLIEEANAKAAAAAAKAAEALAAAQAAGGVDLTALNAAKEAAEAAQAAAEQAAAAAEAAKAAAAASDAEAVAKAAEAAAKAAEAAEKAAAAAVAQAAAQRAQVAAEAARAAADEAAAQTAADKVAAEAAEAAAKAAEAAAKAAKEAAEAADAEAAAEAAKSAASAAEAAKAQAAAQKAQAAAEAAEKAAEAAQAKAEQAAAQAGSDKAAAEAARIAAEAAKVAAQNAKAAAEAAAAAAADSNAAAVAAAAQAAADAAKVAKALEDVAAAKAELAAIQAKAEQDAADAKKAQEAAEKAKAAAEAAELGAARYYALAELARAADGIDTIDYSPEQIEAVAKTVADAIEAIGAAADKAAVEKALADALKAISETPADTCPSRKFTDVPKQGYWAHAGIDYCVANGLMNGMSETVFAPNDLTTRAQLVTILYRAVGSPKVEYKATFSDVPAGIWYSDAIEWAAANGVVNGIGGGKFAPDANVTREQIAAILYRYSGSPKVEGKLDAFKDPADVSPYAVDAMIWATSEGIINGIPDGADVKLSPKDYATRAQIATMFARFLSE